MCLYDRVQVLLFHLILLDGLQSFRQFGLLYAISETGYTYFKAVLGVHWSRDREPTRRLHLPAAYTVSFFSENKFDFIVDHVNQCELSRERSEGVHYT